MMVSREGGGSGEDDWTSCIDWSEPSAAVISERVLSGSAILITTPSAAVASLAVASKRAVTRGIGKVQ